MTKIIMQKRQLGDHLDMTNRGVGVCAVLALLCLSSVSHAQQPPPAPPPSSGDPTMAGAKQHFEAGKVAYNSGDFVNAIREFKAAEQLRPSPILDFNIGLANEKLGKRRVAVKYYRRYLDAMPNAPNHQELQATVANLEAQIAGQGPPGQQPPQQMEQPGDMPPQQQQAYQNQQYDPYAGNGGYVQPYQQRAAPKRSYWWVALIVVGGVAVLTTVIVVAVLYATPTYTTYSSVNRPNLTEGAGLLRANEPAAVVRGAQTVPIMQWRF